MSLTENYFQLFNLPEQYDLDTHTLSDTYRAMQRKAHPDKFAGATKQEQLLSVQYAATINDAYYVLKSPVKRGICLLKLKGIDVDAEQSTAMDSAFLMQQIELREELEEVRDASDPEAALGRVAEHLDGELDNLQAAFVTATDNVAAGDYATAVEIIKKMQFIVKMQEEVERLERELLDF